MKTKKTRTKCAALALSGGMLLGSGACLPDDFWVNAWGNILNSTVEAVVDGYVMVQVEQLVNPDD